MRALELKDPPPVVGLLIAAAMWGVSSWPPVFPPAPTVRLVLAGALYLGALWPFLGPVLFVGYINRFQIAPEERVLRSKFDDYDAYAARVRRWL